MRQKKDINPFTLLTICFGVVTISIISFGILFHNKKHEE